MNSNTKLAAAALMGLLGSASMVTIPAQAHQSTTIEKNSSVQPAMEKHACKGKNSCKGNGADGKNECKGKGNCRTDGGSGGK